MQIGGKQGSRLTGRQFGKLMDTMAESSINGKKGFILKMNFKIPILLWVDDVVSCTEGIRDQIDMMNDINEFAIKHKLEWSTAKCKVMRVGVHHGNRTQWQLGDHQIEETKQYKYLGDEITNNGRNAENIKTRRQKSTGNNIHHKYYSVKRSCQQSRIYGASRTP